MISDNENIKHLNNFDKDETLSAYSNTQNRMHDINQEAVTKKETFNSALTPF